MCAAAVTAAVAAAASDTAARADSRYLVQTTFDDPVDGTLGHGWSVYNGVAAASSVRVANGTLTMTARPHTRGSADYDFGRISSRVNFLYGHGELTYRLDPQRGIRGVIGLWPQQHWTKLDKREIDLFEVNGKTPAQVARTVAFTTAHYLSCGSRLGCMQHSHYRGAFYDWNTLSWNWQPGVFDIWNNGVLVAHYTGAAAPHAPMHLFVNQGLQPGVQATGVGRLQLGAVDIWQ